MSQTATTPSDNWIKQFLSSNKGQDWSQGIGAAASGIDGLLGDQARSETTRSMDKAYDAAADAALQSGNPYAMAAGAAAKVAGLGVDAYHKAGGGTDQMTVGDKILDSKIGTVHAWFGGDPLATTLWAVNEFGRKRSRDFELDQEIQANIGSSYEDTYDELERASAHAGKTYGGLSGGSRRKWNRRIAEAERKQDILSGINITNQDALAASRDPRVGMRTQTNLSGGYANTFGQVAVGKDGLKFAKQALSSYSRYYVLGEPERLQEGGRVRKYKTFEDWMKYLLETRGEPDSEYDYESAYNDKDIYFQWEDREERKPGAAHIGDKYKKHGHMTYSDEGYGWMGDDEMGWVFYVSPRQAKAHSFGEYVDYWDHNEPKAILMYPHHPGYSASVSLPSYKQGGAFNVIPEGALHARLHHMGDSEDITKKGIPIVTENPDGSLTQHAEVERNEVILHLELTKKLEELSEKGTDEAAIEAGKLLVQELLHNTVDNTGLIKEVK